MILIEGLKFDDSNLKNYSKELRKKLNCSCSIVSNKDGKNALKLSSQNIDEIKKYLIEKLQIKKENIRIHGNI